MIRANRPPGATSCRLPNCACGDAGAGERRRSNSRRRRCPARCNHHGRRRAGRDRRKTPWSWSKHSYEASGSTQPASEHMFSSVRSLPSSAHDSTTKCSWRQAQRSSTAPGCAEPLASQFTALSTSVPTSRRRREYRSDGSPWEHPPSCTRPRTSRGYARRSTVLGAFCRQCSPATQRPTEVPPCATRYPGTAGRSAATPATGRSDDARRRTAERLGPVCRHSQGRLRARTR